ncbi:hypothetical protein [Tsukamurella sp. PLM1]|nr:hypothetical protein [Tsukamurella sp. PLM1]
MAVTILAEAGLSECAGHFESPVCKQVNDEDLRTAASPIGPHR